ncbi:HNH endonuclease [Rhizobium lemnae]|uniref:HNH endonuclease n=1 Tax=Rhizobium lemnae TaxID=1214924 RepID=A0ABV8E3I7_9HYPH|nr:HNH endonuclease [Rhizobium lemnae]MCJ8507943.1 HNH endonuclease [Rhizobium lemnae]
MKMDTIKKYLKRHTVMSRKSTFSNAFASALAPQDRYSPLAVADGLRELGQDPEDDLNCVYCGDAAQTWDHVFNRVVDGEFSGYGHYIRNLVPCCRSCNERKGKDNWRHWLAKLAPPDEAERAARIESFLAPLKSPEHIHDHLKNELADELERYREIRRKVFDLMKEADLVAEAIRSRITENLLTHGSTDDR